jgi:hypothetical protein
MSELKQCKEQKFLYFLRVFKFYQKKKKGLIYVFIYHNEIKLKKT